MTGRSAAVNGAPRADSLAREGGCTWDARDPARRGHPARRDARGLAAEELEPLVDGVGAVAGPPRHALADEAGGLGRGALLDGVEDERAVQDPPDAVPPLVGVEVPAAED